MGNLNQGFFAGVTAMTGFSKAKKPAPFSANRFFTQLKVKLNDRSEDSAQQGSDRFRQHAEQ